LMTLGPTLLFLAVTESANGRLSKIFMVFGRTAMFYYILHIYLIHILATLATPLCGHTYSDMIWDSFYNNKLTGYGFSLGIVYSVWLLVLIILYPLCNRYDKYKRLHKEKWWLSYL
jgi:predicted acyltransferase